MLYERIRINYIIFIRKMKERRFVSKTQKKINVLINNTFRSYTNIKQQTQSSEPNAETLPELQIKQKTTVSVTPDTLKEDIITLLTNEASPATANLLEIFNGWTQQKWKDKKMQVSSRLNKLKYLQPSLIGQNYTTTEKEILIEWHKNILLQGLQLLWNHLFKSWKFTNLSQIQKFYNAVRLIITQISYNLFQPSLNQLAKQKFPIEHKLYNYTAVTIITNHTQWPSIVENVIKPQFYLKETSFSENYDLKELNARPELINIDNLQSQFTETAFGLQRLLESYTREDIVNNLRLYRKSLLKQIQQNIQKWQKTNNSKKGVTVQKQDVLSCIIYTLVRHKIDNISLALRYFNFLYGKQIDTVFGASQVDCFRVDIEVAYQYLTMPVIHLSISDFDKKESAF